jgi:hypothetical protein
LKVQYDEPVSNFAFKFNLRRFTKERAGRVEYPRYDPDFTPPPPAPGDYVDVFCRFMNNTFEVGCL